MQNSLTQKVLQIYVRKWPARFELLDGLRGIASLTVVLHHLGITTLGHYAVMVFFIISGYCITASTRTSLLKGVTFGYMFDRRLRRIFPPYVLAVVFFGITRMIKVQMDSSQVWHPSATQWLQNLTLTQWLSMPFANYSEASQNPTLFVASFWSLNYEEQFYLVMGLALLLADRYGFSIYRTIFLLAIFGIAWNVAIPNGWVSGIFIEYWLHFSLGALLYFVLCESPTGRTWRLFAFFVAALSAFSVWHTLRSIMSGAEPQRVYAELTVVSVFTLVLAALRPVSELISHSLWWKPFAAIGLISYSLYLVHQFNLHLVDVIVGRILCVSAPTSLALVLSVLLHVALGAAFWWACERPFLAGSSRKERVVIG